VTGNAQAGPSAPRDLDDVCRLLSGVFSSEAQARRDTSFFDIRLRMAPIWTARADGRWLYVEQATAAAQARPYRQRVYRVTGPDAGGALRSEVFALPGPRRFAGAWRREEPLRELTPDSLLAREGCAVVLRRAADGTFAGGTEGHGCASDLRGAAHATSEVTVGPGGLVSWDRGFAADGTQAWGATQGGYVFAREPDDAPWPQVARAAWLAGAWQVQDGAQVVDEYWTPPCGDSMFGISRAVSGGRLAWFEFVVLRETADGGLVFTAHPSGQEGGSFPAVTVTDTLLVFENPAHDFPQRIGYRRTADGAGAWIEGTVDGQARRVEFPYRRAERR
jgi:hypothetical protein